MGQRRWSRHSRRLRNNPVGRLVRFPLEGLLLERLDRLFRLSQSDRQLAQHPHGDLDVAPDHAIKCHAVDLDQLTFIDRFGGSRPGKPFQHGHLSEEVPLFHRPESLVPPLLNAEQPDLAALNDEHGRPDVPFGEDPLTWGELD